MAGFCFIIKYNGDLTLLSPWIVVRVGTTYKIRVGSLESSFLLIFLCYNTIQEQLGSEETIAEQKNAFVPQDTVQTAQFD